MGIKWYLRFFSKKEVSGNDEMAVTAKSYGPLEETNYRLKRFLSRLISLSFKIELCYLTWICQSKCSCVKHTQLKNESFH